MKTKRITIPVKITEKPGYFVHGENEFRETDNPEYLSLLDYTLNNLIGDNFHGCRLTSIRYNNDSSRPIGWVERLYRSERQQNILMADLIFFNYNTEIDRGIQYLCLYIKLRRSNLKYRSFDKIMIIDHVDVYVNDDDDDIDNSNHLGIPTLAIDYWNDYFESYFGIWSIDSFNNSIEGAAGIEDCDKSDRPIQLITDDIITKGIEMMDMANNGPYPIIVPIGGEDDTFDFASTHDIIEKNGTDKIPVLFCFINEAEIHVAGYAREPKNLYGCYYAIDTYLNDDFLLDAMSRHLINEDENHKYIIREPVIDIGVITTNNNDKEEVLCYCITININYPGND